MGQTRIAVEQHGDMPWPRHALENGGEAVQRHQRRSAALRRAAIQGSRDRRMVGPEDRFDPDASLFVAEAAIAGDFGQLADLRDRARDTGIAIAVYDET